MSRSIHIFVDLNGSTGSSNTNDSQKIIADEKLMVKSSEKQVLRDSSYQNLGRVVNR